MNINKRGGRTYSKSPRDRKLASFLQRYGMEMKEWVSFKKTATKEQILIKRNKAKI